METTPWPLTEGVCSHGGYENFTWGRVWRMAHWHYDLNGTHSMDDMRRTGVDV